MAAADCIEVAFFHHLQILLHLLQSNHKPCYWIGVMTVHPFEEYRFPVYNDLSVISQFYLTESYFYTSYI